MPENFRHLGWIHPIFPNAKRIHYVRNPVDTCLSLYFQTLSDAHHYRWDLDRLASRHNQYRRLIKNWRDILPPAALYDMSYENLVDNPEAEARKLFNVLGLERGDGVRDFHKSDRTAFTASKWQVRQQVYTTS